MRSSVTRGQIILRHALRFVESDLAANDTKQGWLDKQAHQEKREGLRDRAGSSDVAPDAAIIDVEPARNFMRGEVEADQRGLEFMGFHSWHGRTERGEASSWTRAG